MRIVRKVIVPGVPREMIGQVIESISETLAENAKKNFSNALRFKTDIRMVGNNALESYVQFFPYKYDFIWKVNRDELGYEITLDARTPGKWRDALFGMDKKLEELVETQWSAFLNFCHGYLTALAYKRKGGSKRHVKSARKKLKTRK